MARLFLLSLALASACASASASVLPREPEAGPGFLSMPFVERRAVPGRGLRRRDVDEANLGTYSNIAYMIDLAIGTPSQTVRVQVDTGSNELWVDPDCSTVSNADSLAFCETLGTYAPNASSTYEAVGGNATLTYGTGQANITYVRDRLAIPGTNNTALSDVQFGMATASDDAAVPILGLGFGNGYNLDYNNVLDELYEQNFTATRAFSLILATTQAGIGGSGVGDNILNGSIIFGGVDLGKFVGTLTPLLNLVPASGDYWRYSVELNSVGFTKPGSTSSSTYSDSGADVVLDSGSTLSYLPSAVVDDIVASMGSDNAVAQSDGTVLVDCSYGEGDDAKSNGSLDFVFANSHPQASDLAISVPFPDIIWEASPGVCVLGIVATDEAPYLLGDTFLRSVYVLFDPDNQEIYMAKGIDCGVDEQVLSAAKSYNLTGLCTDTTSAAAADVAPLSRAGLLAVAALSALALVL